jgi:hypothetical protein
MWRWRIQKHRTVRGQTYRRAMAFVTHVRGFLATCTRYQGLIVDRRGNYMGRLDACILAIAMPPSSATTPDNLATSEVLEHGASSLSPTRDGLLCESKKSKNVAVPGRNIATGEQSQRMFTCRLSSYLLALLSSLLFLILNLPPPSP